MAASAGPALRQMHRRFGDRITFMTLYVRESHPGERIPQPETFDRKMELAQQYRDRSSISWPVVVDDLAGSVHRQLGALIDSAFITDARGRVVARFLWSNDAGAIERALEAVVAGRRPRPGERQAMARPMLRAAGITDEVLARAGRQAQRDMFVTAPPLWPVTRLAGALRPLPPDKRGPAALVLLTAGALWALRAVRRRCACE